MSKRGGKGGGGGGDGDRAGFWFPRDEGDEGVGR